MRQLITLLLTASFFMYSCGAKEENEKLKMENEELAAELTRTQLAVTTLEQVGTLMDSIDNARNALKLELEAGTDYEDYLSRMEDINNYVKDTESKIDAMEQELNKSASKNQSYINTIGRLRRDLATQTKEIESLQTSVEKYKEDNTNLLNNLDIQEAEIASLEDDILVKREELDLIESKVQEMMKKAQMTEADSYYALGEALEEAAKRTKLAPKKRKETYKEALEYYKQSLAFGREDAQDRITALEEKI